MTWAQKMKDFGGGNFTFLSEDGETITFIVVGDPVLLETNFKGKKQNRIGCPVVTESGYQLFITGKRTARRISKHESLFATNALMVTRQGEAGDKDSKYPVVVIPEQETFQRLCTIRDATFTPGMIQESVEESQESLNS